MAQYVYAGASQFSKNGQTAPSSGLCRQGVGETEWQILSQGLPERAEIRAILIHPDNPHLLYVGTQHGPYRSTDGGAHWEELDFPDTGMAVWSLLFRPNDPQVVYCGTAPAAIYRSENGGDTWKRLTFAEPAGMVEMGFPCRIIGLAADPNDPDAVYAGLEVGGIIRSKDGGDTWEDCTSALLQFAEQDYLKSRILSNTDAEGMMDTHALVLSAAQPGNVFLATRMGLFQSADQGQTWADMEIWRSSPLAYARDIQVAPGDPNTLYAALSPGALTLNGSVYRSPDLGQTWQRFDHGISPQSTMMTVALSRQDPQLVYCGTREGQVFGTQDGGATWGESALPDGCQNVYTLACG